jgi:hypothetical protein
MRRLRHVRRLGHFGTDRVCQVATRARDTPRRTGFRVVIALPLRWATPQADERRYDDLAENQRHEKGGCDSAHR